jgi:hypothetical protein
MTLINVINQSTNVTDAQARAMVGAVAHQVRYDAAPLWGLAPIPVIFLDSKHQAQPGSWVISLLDNSDQADALGWHTEDQGDVIYGRVFTKPVLDNGGRVLTAASVTVSSVLSHEVLETFVDPHVNGWYADGNTLFAAEVGDPVESDSYSIVYRGHAVMVSNFVTPAWFDPQASAHDKFDFMGNVKTPFKMTSGGYVVTMQGGKVSQTFGDNFPEWKKASKLVDTARTGRRNNTSDTI